MKKIELKMKKIELKMKKIELKMKKLRGGSWFFTKFAVYP